MGIVISLLFRFFSSDSKRSPAKMGGREGTIHGQAGVRRVGVVGAGEAALGRTQTL